MPSDPRDPENYSISEMMDRLKERSADRSNGELVTRADGSQAIKVRSRKRRSQQPQRDEGRRTRRVRAVQIVVAVVVIAVLLAGAGALVLYMNGSGYREKVLANMSDISGAEVNLAQFRVTPVGATARTLTFNWPEGKILRKMDFQYLAADLRASSFLHRQWAGEEATAQKGEVWIDTPANAEAGAAAAQPFFQIGGLRCTNLSMYFGNPKSPAMSVLNSEVSLYPQGGGRAELRLTRGELKFRNTALPPMVLDRALINVTDHQLDIVKIELKRPSERDGSLKLKGRTEPFGSGGTTTLDATVENFSLEHLAGADFGRILNGRIDTRAIPNSNFLSFDPNKPDAPQLVLSFSGNKPLVLANLPFLPEIAQLCRDQSLRDPDFDGDVHGVLKMNQGDVTIDDLMLESKGRLVIRGTMTKSANNALSGQLEIGLPPNLVKSDLRMDGTFGPVVQNMRWVTIQLSGSVFSPADDFNRKVIARGDGGASAPGQGSSVNPPTGGGGGASEFEKLTRPR